MSLRKFVAVIIALNLILSCSLTYAFNINDLINKQRDIDKKMQNMENRIKNIENQKDTIEEQIGEINKQISIVQDSLVSINEKLIDNESKLNRLNNEIKETNKKIKNTREKLKARLRVMYENGNTTYLDILLNSGTFTDFITRLDVLKQIVEYDKLILGEMEQSVRELNTKKEELEKVKKQIVQTKKQYELFKEQHLAAKRQKDELMSKLTAEQRRIEREYEQLEQESYRIAQQIQEAQKTTKNTPYAGGKMSWPTPGYYTITSPFGMRFHPILKTYKMHTGIDISAPSGATVVAANDGIVITATYMQGYGNTVVIDHGGGLSTLYAHNSYLLVGSGQKVTRGQAIAKVGNTGYSTGPHCHFEVRSNGAPVNPMGYLQ